MPKPFRTFNNWRRSTYLSVSPIFGADLMQTGPLAVISSLLGRKDEEQSRYPQTVERKGKCPTGGEIYLFQNERFDLVIRDWRCEEDFFDESFLDSLASVFTGYLVDPLNEKDHAWAHN